MKKKLLGFIFFLSVVTNFHLHTENRGLEDQLSMMKEEYQDQQKEYKKKLSGLLAENKKLQNQKERPRPVAVKVETKIKKTSSVKESTNKKNKTKVAQVKKGWVSNHDAYWALEEEEENELGIHIMFPLVKIPGGNKEFTWF